MYGAYGLYLGLIVKLDVWLVDLSVLYEAGETSVAEILGMYLPLIENFGYYFLATDFSILYAPTPGVLNELMIHVAIAVKSVWKVSNDGIVG